MHSFEAMFNLGYMYHHGLGVPKPDPFLAKRYYDQALATHASSSYAVYLSLAHLYATALLPVLLASAFGWGGAGASDAVVGASSTPPLAATTASPIVGALHSAAAWLGLSDNVLIAMLSCLFMTLLVVRAGMLNNRPRLPRNDAR